VKYQTKSIINSHGFSTSLGSLGTRLSF